MSSGEARMDRLLAVITAAFAGDYSQRVPLEDIEDPLLELEVGMIRLGVRRGPTPFRLFTDEASALAWLEQQPTIARTSGRDASGHEGLRPRGGQLPRG